jgi:hypothetical protein
MDLIRIGWESRHPPHPPSAVFTNCGHTHLREVAMVRRLQQEIRRETKNPKKIESSMHERAQATTKQTEMG